MEGLHETDGLIVDVMEVEWEGVPVVDWEGLFDWEGLLDEVLVMEGLVEEISIR